MSGCLRPARLCAHGRNQISTWPISGRMRSGSRGDLCPGPDFSVLTGHLARRDRYVWIEHDRTGCARSLLGSTEAECRSNGALERRHWSNVWLDCRRPHRSVLAGSGIVRLRRDLRWGTNRLQSGADEQLRIGAWLYVDAGMRSVRARCLRISEGRGSERIRRLHLAGNRLLQRLSKHRRRA
jgi:hypothetical protein